MGIYTFGLRRSQLMRAFRSRSFAAPVAVDGLALGTDGGTGRPFVVLAALQLFCGAVFLGDLILEMVNLGRLVGRPDGTYVLHIAGEALGTVVLFVGFWISRANERALYRQAHQSESRLTALREDFDALIDSHFARWQLTAAERDVALLTLRGLRLREISQVRSVSLGTVKSQTHAVLRKSGAGTRAGFIALIMDELLHESARRA